MEEAKRLVREDMCAGCDGTGHGKRECTLEDICIDFKDEVKAQEEDMTEGGA